MLFQHHQISETIIFLRHLEKKLGNLRLAVANHPFSVSIDETTDVCRRYVANIVLKDIVTGKNYLAHTEYLDATNFSSIATCLMNGLQLIHPNGIQYSNALILVTDGASYMKKSYQDILQSLFPKMIHVVCVAHQLHNVAETARQTPSKINCLVKKINYLKTVI